MKGCQLGCHFFLLLSGVGFAAGWSRQCFYCLVSRRMCLTSGLCGECRGNYIEVSSRCVKDQLYEYSPEGTDMVDSGARSQSSDELKMAWKYFPWTDQETPSESDNAFYVITTSQTPISLASSVNSDVNRVATSSPTIKGYKKTTGAEPLLTAEQSVEELAAPADNSDVVLAAASSQENQIRVDVGTHSTKRGFVESTMIEMTTETTTSHSDDRLSDLYLLIVIICSCIIAVMGLIIAYMCWLRMKNQVWRVTDSENGYRKLPYQEEKKDTVNGYTTAQQAELFMYNQKRQQLKSTSPSHIEFELMGEMQSDLGGRQPVLQPGEDEDTLYETPGFSHLQDIKIVNPVFQPSRHPSTLSRSTETSSPTSTGSN